MTTDALDGLDGTLREAVSRLRERAAPRESVERLISLALERKPVGIPAGKSAGRSWRWVAACAAVLALAAVIAAIALQSRNPPQQTSSTTNSGQELATVTRVPDGVGASPRGTSASASRGGAMEGVSPSRNFAVSEDATTLVSTGGNTPIPFGDVRPHGVGNFLHVWKLADLGPSRVLDVECRGSFAVSPDGRSIVTVDGRIVDVASGRSKPLGDFAPGARNLAFSPDGKRLVVQVGENTSASMLIVDAKSGARLCEIPAQWGYTFAAAFSKDATEIALMGADRRVRRWNATSGEVIATYEPAHENSIRAIALSPDSRRLASVGTRGEYSVWDLASGKRLAESAPDEDVATRLKRLTFGRSQMSCLKFSPDGELLAGGSWRSLQIRRLTAESMQLERVLETNPGTVAVVSFDEKSTEIVAVHGFHGVGGDGDQLAYPTLWRGPLR